MTKTKTMIVGLGLLAISLVGLPALVGATAPCNGTITTIVDKPNVDPDGVLQVLHLDNRGTTLVPRVNVYAESNGVPGLQSGGEQVGNTGIHDMCHDPSGVFDTLLLCSTDCAIE